MNRLSLALLLAGVAGGCGTVLNLRDHEVQIPDTPRPGDSISGRYPAPREIYGGVRTDAALGAQLFDEARTTPAAAVAGLAVWGVDLPLSAVADTLTLPLTVPAQWNRPLTATGAPAGLVSAP